MMPVAAREGGVDTRRVGNDLEATSIRPSAARRPEGGWAENLFWHCRQDLGFA